MYVVTGSSGQQGNAGSIGGFPHHAMYYSNKDGCGALMLEVDSNRLDAKWIAADGAVKDQFTMMKDDKNCVADTFKVVASRT